MTSLSSGADRTASRCADCGTPAEPGQSFCDSCGAVLEWAGRRTASRPATGAPGAAPGPGPASDTSSLSSASASSSSFSSSFSSSASGSAPGASASAGRSASSGTGATGSRDSHDGRDGRDDDGRDDRVGRGLWDRWDDEDTDARRGADRSAHEDSEDAGASGTPESAGPSAGRPGGSLMASAPEASRLSSPAPPPDSEDDTEPLPPVPASVAAGAEGAGSAGGGAGSARAEAGLGDTAARARSLLVPVTDEEPREPADPAVAPVLPGRTAQRRPQVRTVGPVTGVEGGAPCPWCATPNRPERNFCARCAMPMTRTEEVGKTAPWWRRLFADRNARTGWAGERPRLRRGFGRVWNWVVGAVVLGLVVALVMNLGTMIQAVRDHFAERAPVGPSTVKASRSYKDHGPGMVFDKLNNTWWGPGITQSAEGEWLEVTFDQPARLLDVVITPGTSPRADQLAESALPKRIDAVVTRPDGTRITKTLTLDQAAGGQRRSFRVGEATAVRFVLRSAYDAGPDKQVAIAEIEFFGPSNANE